jgi:hypothetical protein
VKTKMLKTYSSALLLAGLLSACSPAAPTLQSTPKTDGEAATVAAPVSAKTAFVRKIDILFVVDTSDSMVKHQENLKANIDRFVDSFKKHSDVDFHIGVVSIWDSVRYNKIVKEPYALGKLRPLHDPLNREATVAGVPYITRSQNRFSDVLGETLKVGIESRYQFSTNKKGQQVLAHDASGKLVDGGGPEFEELFSPVLPALGPLNEGFYRKDAHLAVVMITDADDSTPDLTPDLLARQLYDLKGGDHNMVSGYAALALEGCPVDPGREVRNAKGKLLSVNQPTNILDFVNLTGGSFMNLCDENFGAKLGALGKLIEEKASTQMVIRLTRRPDMTTLRVTYVVGGNVLELAPGIGYSYAEDSNEILVHGDSPVVAANPGGEVKVDFTPINWSRYKNGHVKTVGKN